MWCEIAARRVGWRWLRRRAMRRVGRSESERVEFAALVFEWRQPVIHFPGYLKGVSEDAVWRTQWGRSKSKSMSIFKVLQFEFPIHFILPISYLC